MGSYAIVEPYAMMVEIVITTVALCAMFGFAVDSHFAYLTFVFKLLF